MPIVNDDKRKRRYVARPSRRVANPMRTYTFKLGGKQADWLDEFISRSGNSASEVIRGLIQRIIKRKSGIAPEYTETMPALDIEALKAEIKASLIDTLDEHMAKHIASLLADQKRAPMMHNLATQAVQGEGISEAEIANMLEGFNYD